MTVSRSFLSLSQLPGSGLNTRAFQQLEKHLELFENAWKEGKAPALEDFLRLPDVPRRVLLTELIAVDLEYRAAAGRAASIEAFLQRYPELAQDKDALLALIAVEHRLRREPKAALSLDDYVRRFPQVGAEIRGLWPTLTNKANMAQPYTAKAVYPFLQPAQQADEIGRLGGYRVLKLLGSGGMGMVFEAEDPKLKRRVALKVMRPELAAAAVHRHRFLREAQATAAIEHDHIVAIHQVGEDNGVPFLAMPLLQGQALDELVKRGMKFRAAQILRIGREIAEGLAAAHKCGLIHRDIKPSNLWLTPEHGGRIKILDFGLARPTEKPTDADLTETGAVVGTPAYMAPEQARGQVVGTRCDLFSLGCVLYRLCTSELPFKGDRQQVLLAIAMDQPRRPHELNAEVPAALSELVMQLLKKEPVERPASATVVVERIKQIEQSLGSVQAKPPAAILVQPATTITAGSGVAETERTQSLTAHFVKLQKSLQQQLQPILADRRKRLWTLGAAAFLPACILIRLISSALFSSGAASCQIVIDTDASIAEVIIKDRSGNIVARDNSRVFNVPPGEYVVLVKLKNAAGQDRYVNQSVSVVEGESSSVAAPIALAQASPPVPAAAETDDQSRNWMTTGNWKFSDDGLVTLEPRPGEEGWTRFDAYLWAKKQYQDFEIEFEYMLQKGGNSGFYFHVANMKNPVGTGIEVQIADSASKGKDAKLTGHDSGGIFPGIPPTKNAAKPAGEWNHFNIVCRDKKVTIRLNGEVVNEVPLDHSAMKGRPRIGYIGFQDHALPLSLRNIRLRELQMPDGEPHTQARPPEAGWVPLVFDDDTTGWQRARDVDAKGGRWTLLPAPWSPRRHQKAASYSIVIASSRTLK